MNNKKIYNHLNTFTSFLHHPSNRFKKHLSRKKGLVKEPCHSCMSVFHWRSKIAWFAGYCLLEALNGINFSFSFIISIAF